MQAFTYLAIPFIFMKWLISNIWGILTLALILYILSPRVFGITPFTFDELISTVLKLEENQLLWGFGALLSITGYSISGSQARVQKKRDMIFEERKLAEIELRTLFETIISSLTDIDIFIRRMKKLHNEALTSDSPLSIQYNMRFEQAHFLRVQEASQIIGNACISIHLFRPKYLPIIMQLLGVDKKLAELTRLLQEFHEVCFIPMPIFIDALYDSNVEKNTLVNTISNNIYLEQYDAFQTIYTKNYNKIGVLVGGICAEFKSYLFVPNLSTFISLRQAFRLDREEIE